MLEKKTKKTIIACAAAAIMMVGGVSAYFTATDAATNTWTIGNIAIELQEPEYDASDKENIVPKQVLPKDPKVKNTGKNDAFVFLKVSIPKESVSTLSEEGIMLGTRMQELFEYSIENGWDQIQQIDDYNRNIYWFAYAADGKCTALAPGNTTPVLFKDGVITFKNIVEGQLGDEVSIPVEAYAIQTTNLSAGENPDPMDVWEILNGHLVN